MLVRKVLALAALVVATAARAYDTSPAEIPVSYLAGGGPVATDCLAGLAVTGAAVGTRARSVVCEDGDQICDRDRLVNGRCELWVRVCLNGRDTRCAPSGVTEIAVRDTDGDRDLTMLARTLAFVTMPAAAEETCAPLTTLTVPLMTRRNGSARKGRKLVALSATGTGGTTDEDRITFVCKPPRKEVRRYAVSFPTIQNRIFEKSRAFSGCHGVANPQAGLVLVGPGAYDTLVDQPATTAAAAFAGKKRVVPGAPETSFLLDKVMGRLGPNEGGPMPLDRAPLSAARIEAIRKWILAGAPRERVVGTGFRGELDQQPRIPPPEPPPGGFQAKIPPFPLDDVPETEGCQLARLGNPEDIFVQKWELFMHEGSHHFIVRAFRCRDADGDGVNDCDEPDFDSRFPTGFAPCAEFGSDLTAQFVVGSQTPHFIVDYQTPTTGVGLALHRNQPLLLNSHYTNPYRDTLAEVWVNVTPADPALVTRPAHILFETLANAFIKVPPGTAKTSTAETCAFKTSPLCELAGEPPPAADFFALLGLTSHMHKRSLKFVGDLHDLAGTRIGRTDDITDIADGSKHLYVNREWSDPINLGFWPPIIVQQGQKLDYACFHDNGVKTPVKLGCEETAGVPPGKSIVDQVVSGGATFGGAAKWCTSDADCVGFGTGRCVPANLVFGERADDDMCILPGLYYRCPGDAASCGG